MKGENNSCVGRMRILHFADLHIGAETYGSVDPATGLSTRLLDILRVLDEVVDFAINTDVDLVIFCGDAYKNRDPSQTQQREFAKRLRRLSEADIPVFLLVGNHDLPGAIGRATSIDIFDTLAVPNMFVGNRPDIYRITTKSGEVQVVALPWPRRNVLLSKEESKNLTMEQVNEKLEEIMTRRIAALASEVDSSIPVILAGHVSVSTATVGTESSMIVGRDPVMLIGTIANPAFDYVALGHVHKTQILAEAPPTIYAGSLERLDFGDENENKGFYVITIENQNGDKDTTYEFHPVGARRFYSLKVDVTDDELDATAYIVEAIDQHQEEVKDAVVRLIISCPRTMETLLRYSDIYRALTEAYDVIISKDIKQESRSRLGDIVSEELSPVEALKLYLETKNVPEQRKKTLLTYGEKLIRETLSDNRGE
jgi:exonuclease SbcD